MNIDVWLAPRLNQLFVRDSYTQIKFSKSKVVSDKIPLFVIGPFYIRHSLFLHIAKRLEAVVRRYSVKKSVLNNFTKFSWKHLYQSIFFKKVTGLRPTVLLKKRCFPVNFVEFLCTPISIEHLWSQILKDWAVLIRSVAFPITLLSTKNATSFF